MNPENQITKVTPADDFALTVIVAKEEPRIDSRLMARQFGNKHKPVIALIDKYLDRFKDYGQVLFKKADGDRKQGGGMAERFALLNEDQAFFLLSLSRNSETVVDLKGKLVKAFGVARRAAEMRKTEYLPAYHDLHDQLHILADGSIHERHVHMNVNKLLNKFAGVESGQRTSAALPQQALLIVGQMAALKAAKGAQDHHDGYQAMKTSLQSLSQALMLEVTE